MKTIITKLLLTGCFLTASAHASTNLAETPAAGKAIDARKIADFARTNAGFQRCATANRVTFGQGISVAVDGHDYVLISADGREWTRQPTGNPFALYAAVFA